MESLPLKEVLQLVSQFGLGIVLALFGALAFWNVLNRVFDENKTRDERIAAILDTSLKTLTDTTKALSELIVAHDRRAEDAISSIKESNRYQREEHMKMIQALDRIMERTAA